MAVKASNNDEKKSREFPFYFKDVYLSEYSGPQTDSVGKLLAICISAIRSSIHEIQDRVYHSDGR